MRIVGTAPTPDSLTACTKLADLMLAGNGVPQDGAAAEKVLDYACRNHNYAACFNIGVLKVSE